jgi:type IV pilus assembly protein PilX
MKRYGTSNGFALIISLLFLIVLTILGVSAMSNVGLQERMASNLKEKERASEASELGTRGAELFLAEFPPSNVLDEIPVVSSSPTVNEVWSIGGPIGLNAASLAPDVARAFSNDANWFFDDPNRAKPIVFNAPPFDNDNMIGSGVNPEDLATGAGVFYYRVTGRGVGGNDTAVSVVQSMYSRRFK